MKRFRLAVLAVVALTALAAFASPALATPSRTTLCSNCHSGVNVAMTVTPVSNNGTTATYNVSAPTGNAIAVFDGTTKKATISSSSGQFSVAVGKTYDIFAVKGPNTNSGIGHTTVSPIAPVPDTTAPVTTSNAVASYSGTALITLSPTDGGSGVAHTYYRLDGAAQVEGTSVSVSTIGTHTVEFWSVDVAGNIETHKFANFTVTVPAGVVYRFAGAGRYDVAAAIARKGWDPSGNNSWPGVEHIIVASGEDAAMADPLAAAGLAGAYDAPVLTVTKYAVPTATKNAITAIAKANPGVKVHIVGGTGSVSAGVWTTIKAIPGVSPTYDRIAGADRYAVTANIGRRIVSVVGTDAVQGVLLVCSENPAAFYDALAASPIAYDQHMPMIGVRAASVPGSVASFISAMKAAGKPVYAVSPSLYISNAVATSTGATRLSTSTNRYTSAVYIASQGISGDPSWLDARDTGLAAKLPDALTGGAFMGKQGGVLLFTDSTTTMQAAPKTFFQSHASEIERGWVFGGTGSLSSAVQTQYLGYIQ